MSSEIDKYIQSKVKNILDENKFPDYDDIYSDTFSELIDKLIIVHIRLWYLEDAISIETDPINSLGNLNWILIVNICVIEI